MNKPQAKAVLGLLSAAFPREPMPDSSLEMWSLALLDHDFEDTRNGVELAALTMDRMPSLHQIVGLAEDMRKQRQRDAIRPLPDVRTQFGWVTFPEWLKTQPTEIRDRVRRLGPGFAKYLEEAS